MNRPTLRRLGCACMRAMEILAIIVTVTSLSSAGAIVVIDYNMRRLCSEKGPGDETWPPQNVGELWKCMGY